MGLFQGTAAGTKNKLPGLITSMETTGAKALEEFADNIKVGLPSLFSLARQAGLEREVLWAELPAELFTFHEWGHLLSDSKAGLCLLDCVGGSAANTEHWLLVSNTRGLHRYSSQISEFNPVWKERKSADLKSSGGLRLNCPFIRWRLVNAVTCKQAELLMVVS